MGSWWEIENLKAEVYDLRGLLESVEEGLLSRISSLGESVAHLEREVQELKEMLNRILRGEASLPKTAGGGADETQADL